MFGCITYQSLYILPEDKK